LADTVLAPHYSDDVLELGRATMGFMSDEARAEVLSRDAIVQAAYPAQPLGQFHMCSLDAAGKVSDARIQSFRASHLYGENCVISGAGIEHDALVRLSDKIFKTVPSKGIARDVVRSKRPASLYTGGLIKNQRPLKEPFAKVCVGFEVGGWTHPNFTTVCVLQQLLGGGSSFSAGGPGKGMYSRLYREVLSRFNWVEGAEAFVSIHEGAGILGIDGACGAEQVQDMLMVILNEFVRLTFDPVKDIELSRAKNMLKSMLLMQLESRLVLCEDMARQLNTYGYRKSPEEMCRDIDAVTAKDIMALAQSMIVQNPAIGCVGADLAKVPQYAQVLETLHDYRRQLKAKGFLP
jgi:processing peptidase subunit alpha